MNILVLGEDNQAHLLRILGQSHAYYNADGTTTLGSGGGNAYVFTKDGRYVRRSGYNSAPGPSGSGAAEVNVTMNAPSATDADGDQLTPAVPNTGESGMDDLLQGC